MKSKNYQRCLNQISTKYRNNFLYIIHGLIFIIPELTNTQVLLCITCLYSEQVGSTSGDQQFYLGLKSGGLINNYLNDFEFKFGLQIPGLRAFLPFLSLFLSLLFSFLSFFLELFLFRIIPPLLDKMGGYLQVG